MSTRPRILVTNPLSQRLKVSFGKGHRHARARRPSPPIARHTADETLTKSVDLDERSIAARTAWLVEGHQCVAFMSRGAAAVRW
jgi:hypothetical protein